MRQIVEITFTFRTFYSYNCYITFLQNLQNFYSNFKPHLCFRHFSLAKP